MKPLVSSTMTSTETRNEHERFLAAVREGLADSQAGRLVDDDLLASEIEMGRWWQGATTPQSGRRTSPSTGSKIHRTR